MSAWPRRFEVVPLILTTHILYNTQTKLGKKKAARTVKNSFSPSPWFITILLTGVDVSAKLVELAGKLSKEAGETTKWPLIEEKSFEQAAKMLDILDYRYKET